MTPPRWNTKNADTVRTELVRRFENEPSPAPDRHSSMWSAPDRGNTVRLTVAIVIALALIVPASVCTFALAGRSHPAGGSHSAGPTTISSPAPVDTATTMPKSTIVGGGTATPAASPTCMLRQLTLSEPGPGGASTGEWVQLVTIRNRGTACTLPVTAFTLGGRVAQASRTGEAAGFALAAAGTARIAVITNIGCGDGSGNTSVLGPNAKPLVFTMEERDAAGLHRLMPVVSCAGLFVERLN